MDPVDHEPRDTRVRGAGRWRRSRSPRWRSAGRARHGAAGPGQIPVDAGADGHEGHPALGPARSRRAPPVAPEAPAPASHVRRSAPSTTAAVEAMLASAQLAAATLTVRHCARTGSPDAWVEDVVHRAAVVQPAARRDARSRQPAGLDRDRLALGVGPVAMVVGDVDRPAAGRRPARWWRCRHRARRARRRPGVAAAVAARSAASALAVAPRSSADARRAAGRRGIVDELDLSPEPARRRADNDAIRRVAKRRVALGTARELAPVTVVSGADQALAERRIDGAVGDLGGADAQAPRPRAGAG